MASLDLKHNKNMSKAIEIRRWLTRLNYIQFIGLQTAIGLLIIVFTFATITIFKVNTPQNGVGQTFIAFLLLEIVNAIAETLLFQHLPFIIMSHRTKNVPSKKVFKPTRYVMFSSALFGLFHIITTRMMMPFAIIRVLSAALFGMVLSVSFYILHRKKQLPILSVSLIHFLVNTLLVCVGTWIDSLTASFG